MVIGATGGSGNWVVARIVRAGGMYIGVRNLNPYEDALDFGYYSDRWINRYLASGRDLPKQRSPKRWPPTSDRSSPTTVAGSPPRRSGGGGRSRAALPPAVPPRTDATLRFLHFVRDGRDMAFSDNQKQLRKHGPAALAGRLSWRQPVRSIALWSRVNQSAADYGERELGSDYLRVRFEDLCAEPRLTVELIYAFFGLEGDLDAAASEVQPPQTLGRWHERSRRLVARLEREAGPALRRFGYYDS